MSIHCGHTAFYAQAVFFWPLIGALVVVILICGAACARYQRQARVARERARRLEVQLKTWKEHT